jgi:hypothetical protein
MGELDGSTDDVLLRLSVASDGRRERVERLRRERREARREEARDAP